MMIAVVACGKSESAPTGDAAATAPPSAATAVSTVAVEGGAIDIQVGSEFAPATIVAKAGEPLTLRFHRGKEASCGDEVIFPALNQTHKLGENQVTTVQFTPEKAGELAFTCGMNMMKGKIVVQ